MQAMTPSPQATSPYTPVGGGNAAPPQPQVPGVSGGLPALGGLSVNNNPMAPQLQSTHGIGQPSASAQHAQQFGRGDDTMLIHMTPEEVNSLQGLAMAHGGSLTINPHTGLPEAGWLGKLLPTLLGGIGMAFGIPPIWMGLGGAAVGTAVTGDLGKGLSMGLQAYGGASLGGAAGIGGKLGNVGQSLGLSGSSAIGGAASNTGTLLGTDLPAGSLAKTALAKIPGEAAATIAKTPDLFGTVAKGPGFFGAFGNAAKAGLPGGIIGKVAPMLAAQGVMSGVSGAMQPSVSKGKPEESKFKYTPMAPLKREVRFQTPEQAEATGGAEFQYFTPSNPEPVPVSALPIEEQSKYRYADGGVASAPPTGLGELIEYFGASNPGAITASSKYPAPAAPTPTAPVAPDAGEQKFNFTPTTPTTPTLPTTGGTNLWGLPDFTSDQWKSILGDISYQGNQLFVPAAPDERNRFEDYSNIGDQGAFPRRTSNGSGIDGTGQSLPTEQPVAPAPEVSSPVASLPEYDYSQYYQPNIMDLYNNYGQTTPTEQPVYAEPVAPVAPAYEEPVFSRQGGGGGGTYNNYDNVQEFARGGGVHMRDGAFVVDARTVSELGNGSSNAGIELLARMGGRPVRGSGDGVSDSVPASIGGKQQARVARDEVIFQPDAVRRIGGGSEKRGTQKLYALMEKAHSARKKAKRGQDTGVRRGLA